MTITYPRALPNNARMSECWFDLQDNVSVGLVGTMLLNLSQVVPPVWRGTFVTGLLEHSEKAVWSSWRKSLRTAKTFVAYDVRRAAPLFYTTAKVPADISGSWVGTAGVTSVGLSGSLGLSSLPVGYHFKAGDRVGLEQSGKYGYYEVLEDVTANGSGAVTVTVAPFLHSTVFDTGAVCRVWRPLCQFVIDQSSWSEQGTLEITPVSFNGIQRL